MTEGKRNGVLLAEGKNGCTWCLAVAEPGSFMFEYISSVIVVVFVAF